MGYSRQQFYEIRRNFQTYGAEGLIDRLPGAKGPHPNRVAAEIEEAILDHALVHPCHGRPGSSRSCGSRAWYTDVAAEMKDAEVAFLREEIYRRDVDPPMRAITAYDRYSARC